MHDNVEKSIAVQEVGAASQFSLGEERSTIILLT